MDSVHSQSLSSHRLQKIATSFVPTAESLFIAGRSRAYKAGDGLATKIVAVFFHVDNQFIR